MVPLRMFNVDAINQGTAMGSAISSANNTLTPLGNALDSVLQRYRTVKDRQAGFNNSANLINIQNQGNMDLAKYKADAELKTLQEQNALDLFQAEEVSKKLNDPSIFSAKDPYGNNIDTQGVVNKIGNRYVVSKERVTENPYAELLRNITEDKAISSKGATRNNSRVQIPEGVDVNDIILNAIQSNM